MADSRRPRQRPAGHILLVIVVIIVLIVAAGLLNQVASLAQSINGHAGRIADDTQTVNKDTDAVLLLDRTNQLAASILNTAQPLNGQLGSIDNLARSIDAKAKSINGSATSINDSAGTINGTAGSIGGNARTILGTAQAINGTAGQINGTAGSINSVAAAILDVARRINADVQQINRNVDQTIALARLIHSDTTNLVSGAHVTLKEAACIDREVHTILAIVQPPPDTSACDAPVGR